MEIMTNTLILDTNIIIDFMRGNKEVVNRLRGLNEKYALATTDVSVFELYKGAYKSKSREKNLTIVKGLIDNLLLISADKGSMEVAAKISVDLEKKGRTIDIRDLFIGSICLANSCKLLTRNVKDFENIPGLGIIEIESP